MTLQKQYLVIKNCGQDTYLRKYLEQICDSEHIQVVTEYISTNWFEQQKPSLHAELDAKPMYDCILCSYDENKLLYVKYLYDKFEKLSMQVNDIFYQSQVMSNPNKNNIESMTITLSWEDTKQSKWQKFKKNIVNFWNEHNITIYCMCGMIILSAILLTIK